MRRRRGGRRARYDAALLELQLQARRFVQALGNAAQAAQALDPEGRCADSPLARHVQGELVALLRLAAAQVPGAAELLALALSPAEP